MPFSTFPVMQSLFSLFCTLQGVLLRRFVLKKGFFSLHVYVYVLGLAGLTLNPQEWIKQHAVCTALKAKEYYHTVQPTHYQWLE